MSLRERGYLTNLFLLCLCLIVSQWTVASRPNTLVLATYDFKPYVTFEQGRLGGDMVKQVKLLCKMARVQCYLLLLPKQHGEWLVRRGKVDGFFPAEWTRERAAAMVFTQPLSATTYGLYALAHDSARTNASQLKRIGVEEESADFSYAKHWTDRRIQDYQLKPFLSLDVALYALNKGYIDRVYANEQSAQWWINQGKYSNIERIDVDRHLRYYIAFGTRTVPPLMAQRFERAYWALVKTGSFKKVS